MKIQRHFSDKKGYAVVYSMFVTAMLAVLLLVGWMMGQGLSKNSVETLLFREAHVVATSCLREFMAGAGSATHEGAFTNGYNYRVVITTQHSPSAGLERMECTVLWETEAPLPENAVTASHTLSLSATRLSP